MSRWGLAYKGVEIVTPEEWNLIIDALNELDGRVFAQQKGGTVTFSGDGSEQIFEFSHELTGIPDIVMIGHKSTDSVLDKWWEANSTKIIVHCVEKTKIGTNNISFWWLAIKQ